MEEKYGEVEEMNVCDNLGDHLVGNVYVKVGLRRHLGPRSEACLPHLSEQPCSDQAGALMPWPALVGCVRLQSSSWHVGPGRMGVLGCWLVVVGLWKRN